MYRGLDNSDFENAPIPISNSTEPIATSKYWISYYEDTTGGFLKLNCYTGQSQDTEKNTHNFYRNGKLVAQNQSELFIQNMTVQDGGEYTCDDKDGPYKTNVIIY